MTCGKPIGGLFRAVGLIVGFGALYLLTFHDLIDEAGRIDGVDYRYWVLTYAASVIAVAAMAGLEWWRVRRWGGSVVEPFEIATVVLLLTASHVLVRVPAGWEPLYPIVLNALFALAALGLMVSGYLQGREGRINLAMALIALFIISRYFEYSTTLFDRSLVFVGAGVILLAGGFLLERGRRRMLSTMRATEGEAMKSWTRIAFWIVVAGQLVLSARLHRRQGSIPPHRNRGRAANRTSGPTLPAARRLRHPRLRNRPPAGRCKRAASWRNNLRGAVARAGSMGI